MLLRSSYWVFGIGLAAALSGYAVLTPPPVTTTDAVALRNAVGDVDRGEYVLRMGGCVVCHTDFGNEGAFLAGGGGLETAFGTFYAPNITPDPVHGIGKMSLDDFYAAMTGGVTPHGQHYFPSFPYTSYAKMDAGDIVDLKAYLDTVAPAAVPARPHELIWPFSVRNSLILWKALHHSSEPFAPDASQTAKWNRGAYLVNGPGHCGECHTARNLLGGLSGKALEGAEKSMFSPGAPALAGSRSTIGDWGADDLIFYLQFGLKPNGDSSGGKMTDVIEHSTGHLKEEDLEAIAVYLLSLQI
jgi:mono/diheme cytochrome c family protein